jgi:starch synthase
MKIALVAPTYPPTQTGGAEVSMKLLAEGLRERGNEVIVLVFDGDRRVDERVSGVRVIRYRHIKGLTDRAQPLTLLPLIVRAMKQWQSEVDLFHVYNVFPLPGAGMYKLLGGKKPVVATFNAYAGFCPLSHGLCPSNNCSFIQRTRCLFEARGITEKMLSIPYSAAYPILIGLAKMSDKYIALSQGVKAVHVEHGYNKDRIVVIPNFVEQATLPASPRLEERHHFNILYVGKLALSKGVDVLLQAFFKIGENNQNLHLTVVGDGPQRAQLLDLALKLGVDKRVFFANAVAHEDVWSYYRNADAFVHPGIWAEPFGRTILEAMQFNLPLIVSNIGAPPEIAGDAALVFEPGNVDDLAQKLELIYMDGKLRQRLSSNCSKTLQNYDRDEVIGKIIALYQEVSDKQ